MAGIVFIGPSPKTLRTLGNKVDARNLAISIGVPVMPATEPLPDDADAIKAAARAVGYPVMLKASWGGGGRGMRPIEAEDKLIDAVFSAKREAKAAFGKDEVYLEKLVRRARHVEVQILGDTARHHRASVRARLLDPAPQPEGHRARAGALSRRRRRGPSSVRGRAQDRTRHQLCRRRHRRVPDGCRHRRVLLHRGQSAHPGRAHGHRGRHRSRHRQGADPHRRGRAHRRRLPMAATRRASRRSPRSSSAATRCNAGSPPRTPRTISFRTMAASPPIAAPWASASASMVAPPIPARW